MNNDKFKPKSATPEELRLRDARIFGHTKTRANKRKSEKLYRSTSVQLSKLSEMFMETYLNNLMDINAKPVKERYLQLNERWKSYARKIIKNNTRVYDRSDKRIKFISSFENFVNNLEKENQK